MANTEKLIPVQLNGNGYTTVQNFTSKAIIRPDQLSDAVNVNMFDGIGIIKSAKGYSPKGTAAGSKILGLYTHFTRDGVATPIRVYGTTIQYWNGSAWTNSNITNLTTNKIPYFTTFINRTIMVNGAEKYSTADGITWDATLVSSMSIASPLYIDHFATRLVYADKTTVYWSSLPQGTSPSFTLNYSTRYSITPETDDGDFITGIQRLRFRELVFKNYSVHRLYINGDLVPQLSPISEEIGCPTQNSIITYQGYCYFFGTTRDGERGFFRSNGESVELISRGISSWLSSIAESSFVNIRVGLHKGVIKWAIGTTDIVNCEIQYSPRDEGWQRRSLKSSVTCYAPCQFGTEKGIYFGAEDGAVYHDEYGTEYTLASGTSYPIQMEITTHPIQLDRLEYNRHVRRLSISGTNLKFIQVSIRKDGQDGYDDTQNIMKNRTDLYKSYVDMKTSKLQMKIVSIQYGAEIEKVEASVTDKKEEVA